jgi:hypothetical protein
MTSLNVLEIGDSLLSFSEAKELSTNNLLLMDMAAPTPAHPTSSSGERHHRPEDPPHKDCPALRAADRRAGSPSTWILR